jgi:DNA-binding CsgD family transcriptional regulator
MGEHADAARSVDDAVASATRLDQPALLSAAHSMRALLQFWLGNGVDHDGMHVALAVDDHHSPAPVVYQPRMHNAILLSCTGHLDTAHDQLFSIRQYCGDRGEESDQNFVAFHSVLNELWRGDFAEATLLAEDAVERARQLDGDLHFGAALFMRAACAAYAGREDDARRDAGDALAAVRGSDSSILTGWPTAILGFLEVSLGNYAAAITVLGPLLARFDRAPAATEIYVASYLPDAVEAMVALGKLAEAQPLVDALERNGARHDRAWMLAVGARCRAMLMAGHGDLEAAKLNAQRAMVEHDRLPMPFERARTQLLLGQLQRRQREKDISAVTLRDALSCFEELDTPLWAERARAELTRVHVGAHQSSSVLTPSEQRVAELAASGLTNREVAARLFISPKTVEVNIYRIYRKLGIRSRAELGRTMGQ